MCSCRQWVKINSHIYARPVYEWKTVIIAVAKKLMRNITTKKKKRHNLESLLNGCFDSLLLFSKSCSSPSHLLHHFTTNIVLRKWFFSFGFFCSFIFANFWIITEECMFCLKYCLTLYLTFVQIFWSTLFGCYIISIVNYNILDSRKQFKCDIYYYKIIKNFTS